MGTSAGRQVKHLQSRFPKGTLLVRLFCWDSSNCIRHVCYIAKSEVGEFETILARSFSFIYMCVFWLLFILFFCWSVCLGSVIEVVLILGVRSLLGQIVALFLVGLRVCASSGPKMVDSTRLIILTFQFSHFLSHSNQMVLQ